MAPNPGYLEANWNKVEAVLELMVVVDLFSGFNKLVGGLRVEPDDESWCV